MAKSIKVNSLHILSSCYSNTPPPYFPIFPSIHLAIPLVINLFSDKDFGLVDIGQKGPKGITTVSVQFIQTGGHLDTRVVGAGLFAPWRF